MTRAVTAVAGALLVALLAVPAPPALAQDGTTSSTLPSSQVPTQDIVPRPNTGEEPEEAGDRGGALQLLLPVIMAAAIGGGGWHLSRQAKRARASDGA